MGLAPADVDRLSLAQYIAVCEGWRLAHGGEEKPEPPTADEYYRLTGKRRR